MRWATLLLEAVDNELRHKPRCEEAPTMEPYTPALPSSRVTPRDVGLRVVGLGVACLGGVFAFLLTPNPFGVSILTALVIGGVSAFLVRARWALLAVPAAIWLGAQVPEFVYATSHALLEDPLWWGGTQEWALLLFVWLGVPAMIGAFLGLGAARRLEARRGR
jgi:hypothetical protein